MANLSGVGIHPLSSSRGGGGRAEEEDDLSVLVSGLADPALTARAAGQLTQLVDSGSATVVLKLLLARSDGEGLRGAGARRAVAKVCEQAVTVAGAATLPCLPQLMSAAALALGDGESSVRDSYAAALAAAARHAGAAASGREVFSLLIRPLLRAIDQPARPLQQGAAYAMREVVRALQPEQLRPFASQLFAALRRHIQAAGTHGRPALLDAATALLAAVPEVGSASGAALLSLATAAALSTDWHERLASVSLLRQLGGTSAGGPQDGPREQAMGHSHGLTSEQRSQIDTSLRALRYDKLSVVRQAANPVADAPPTPTPTLRGASRPSTTPGLNPVNPAAPSARISASATPCVVASGTPRRRGAAGTAVLRRKLEALLAEHEEEVAGLLGSAAGALTEAEDRVCALAARVARATEAASNASALAIARDAERRLAAASARFLSEGALTPAPVPAAAARRVASPPCELAGPPPRPATASGELPPTVKPVGHSRSPVKSPADVGAGSPYVRMLRAHVQPGELAHVWRKQPAEGGGLGAHLWMASPEAVWRESAPTAEGGAPPPPSRIPVPAPRAAPSRTRPASAEARAAAMAEAGVPPPTQRSCHSPLSSAEPRHPLQPVRPVGQTTDQVRRLSPRGKEASPAPAAPPSPAGGYIASPHTSPHASPARMAPDSPLASPARQTDAATRHSPLRMTPAAHATPPETLATAALRGAKPAAPSPSGDPTVPPASGETRDRLLLRAEFDDSLAKLLADSQIPEAFGLALHVLGLDPYHGAQLMATLLRSCEPSLLESLPLSLGQPLLSHIATQV